MKSFLICDHDSIVNFYVDGIPVANYHKPRRQWEVLDLALRERATLNDMSYSSTKLIAEISNRLQAAKS